MGRGVSRVSFAFEVLSVLTKELFVVAAKALFRDGDVREQN
jgi:hypothetical protein